MSVAAKKCLKDRSAAHTAPELWQKALDAAEKHSDMPLPLLCDRLQRSEESVRISRSILKNPALGGAMERGQKSMERILKDKSLLTAEQFAKRLGVTRDSVGRLRREGKVIALRLRERNPHYRCPDRQINPASGKVYQQIQRLLELLSSPFAVYAFLLNQTPGFGGKTGLEVMRAGENEHLFGVAQGQAEGAFS